MQLGMIGLGRMGANMVRRLIRDGHNCVVFDRSPEAVSQLVKEKAAGAASLAAVLQQRQRWAGRTVGITISGGNVDSDLFAKVLSASA